MSGMISIHHILEAETHLEGIDAAVFDLDDTLYSEKDYVRSGYRAVAETFPDVPQMEEKLWRAFEGGGRAIDEVLAQEGLYTEQNKCTALRAYREHMPSIRLYDGVFEMLERLSQTKKIGIITDGRPEGQRAKIRALGLDELVDEIIVTDELGGAPFRKPNEAAFLLMQTRMNTPFEKMAYIGDNAAKDFAAPQRLGMRCVWFRNQDGLYSNVDSTYA